MNQSEGEDMSKNFTIDETLNKIDSLYTDFENTLGYIKTYNNKYDVAESNSVEIVNSERAKSYKTLITTLAAQNLGEVNMLITKLNEKLERLRKFTLSEIAHRKLKEAEFQIDNPFFFRKLRNDYRSLTSDLDVLDEDAMKKSAKDIKNLVLRFENVIERLRNFEYEIEDEKKSGLYNLIAKSAVWGIPILIGLYQLIAMQYFILNPYLPLAAYTIGLFVIYFLLRSITEIKFLYRYAKANKSYFLLNFGPSIIGIPVMIFFLITAYITHELDMGIIIATIVTIMLLIALIIINIKDAVGKSKSDLIQNELEDIAIKYGVKE
jgi:hypothetical protein